MARKRGLDQKASTDSQNPSGKNKAPHFKEGKAECSGNPMNHWRSYQWINGYVRHCAHI